jgi:hypothetical protein
LVLHGLRLKGFATPDVLAVLSALEGSDVQRFLGQLASDGLVHHRVGRITGWSLTASGRLEHRELVGAELAAAGRRDALEDAYRRFLAVNGDLLKVCTDWQLRVVNGSQAINDHREPAYDAAVIERLVAIHTAVERVCDDLGAALARFVPYRRRLAHALDRVQAGEPQWFTAPLIESYHTVWFELHEDLLATLGIERAKEAVS